MTDRKGPGRPPRPARRRTKKSVRFSVREWAGVEETAEAEGTAPLVFVREAALEKVSARAEDGERAQKAAQAAGGEA